MVGRIEYIDRMRGLAMMLVVAGHVLFYNGYASSPLCYAIYAFHMPLFFIISGYVNHYVWKPIDVWSYFKKSGMRLIVPYVLWSIIFVVAQSIQMSDLTLNTACSMFPVWAYWFIPCLFIMHWMHYAVYACKGKVWQQIGIILCLLVIVVGMYVWLRYELLKRVIAYIIPYAFGVLLAEKPEVLQTIIKKRWLAIINAMVGMATMVVYYYAPNAQLIAQVARLVCGLSMSCMLLYAYYNLEDRGYLKRWGGIESYVGKCTMGTYFIHQIIVRAWMLPDGMGLGMQMITTIGSMAAITTICVGFIWIIQKIPVVNKLLLGK